MKTKKTFFAIAAIALIFSNAFVAQTKKPAPSKNGGGTQKTVPAKSGSASQKSAAPAKNGNGIKKITSIPKTNSKPNPAIQDTANWDIKSLDTARSVDYLSEIEKDVILEMNKARSNPKKYAELYLVPFAKKFRSDGTYMKNGVMMLTHEGLAVVNECIKEMSAKKAVEILRPEKGLSLAAQGHATSQAKAGQIGHNGTDGSTTFSRIQKYGVFRAAGENISYGCKDGQEIVMQLLIDDGVKGRGHRKNILNSAFTQTGVGYAEGHKVYKTECVITYAGGYEEKK